jgi:hypothetical protein
MKLARVVPIGRSLDEYERMFRLSDRDRAGAILGAGDGPASFNAELTRAGGSVVSIDPIYALPPAEIAASFDASFDAVFAQVDATPDAWSWTYHPSPAALREHRRRTFRAFEADLAAGLAAGRYVAAELPALPFPDHRFDLALCSHLLFLYSEQLDAAFHVAAILELLRVAREVRIFPLHTLANVPSPHLEPVTRALEARGRRVTRERVDYELQKGANEMLRAG